MTKAQWGRTMRIQRKWLLGGVAAVIVALAGTGLVIANGNDTDTPLKGTALEQATQAALEYTGGGAVLETEVDDDGAAYGVEIRRDDGSVVEVQLDDSFQVIGQEIDHDGAADDDAGADR